MPIVRSAALSNCINVNNVTKHKRAHTASTTKLASISTNSIFNSNSKLKISGVNKLQYITDSIWSYSPEYSKFKLNKKLKEKKSKKKQTIFPNLTQQQQQQINLFGEQTTSFTSIKLPDLNVDLDLIIPPPSISTYSNTSTPIPVQMIPEATDLSNQHEQFLLRTTNDANRRHQQQRQSLRFNSANGMSTASITSSNPPRTQQVYSHLIEPKNNHLVISAASKLNRSTRKKPIINVTSTYAIENDNFIANSNDATKQFDDKESDDYYDYLELKHQLFHSSLKPTNDSMRQEDLNHMSPAKLRLNNLNKNLHSLIKNKRLKSAGAASNSSATAAFFEDNFSPYSPRQQQMKQPQVLNMKFKSAGSSASNSSQISKSKPGSASTFHSSNRSANSNKSYETKTKTYDEQTQPKIVIYGKQIDNITAADLLSVLSDGINKKMIQFDDTAVKNSNENKQRNTKQNRAQYMENLNKEIEKRAKAGMEFFELNYDDDYEEFAELEYEEDDEEDLDYEDEDYYDFIAAATATTDLNQNEKNEQNNEDMDSKENDKEQPLMQHTSPNLISTSSKSIQVNIPNLGYDDYSNDNNSIEIKPTIVKSIITIPTLTTSSSAIMNTSTAINNDLKKSASLQILNGQKRRNKLKLPTPTLTTNSKIRVKSAKSDKPAQQPHSAQQDNQPLTNYELHMQPDYINKQNKLILNKIKNYSKNTDIELNDNIKMKQDFATNFFDSRRENCSRNDSASKYPDVINDEFRQVLNKYDTIYATADQFIKQQLPPPESYMFNSPQKESDTNTSNSENNTNSSIDMYNLLKRMMVKKKYVMHTVRQENINISTRARMKRLLNQQQQQQQNTSTTVQVTTSPSSSAQLTQQPTQPQTKTRPSTAAVSDTNENINQQNQQNKQSKYKINRPKTANIISVRQQSANNLVDLTNYEVTSVKTAKQDAKTNSNNKKVAPQAMDDDNYYEQFRLSPTMLNTQNWPYELDFEKYVKRRNLLSRIKAVKIVPLKKVPLVKIELLQTQQTTTEQTDTSNIPNLKNSNLKTRPSTAIRTSAAAILNSYKQSSGSTYQLENDMSKSTNVMSQSDYRRCMSAKYPTQPSRSLIKITFDTNSKQSIESLKNDLNDAYNDSDDGYIIEQDDCAIVRRRDSFKQMIPSKIRTMSKKSVTIDDNSIASNSRKTNELKVPICTCHIVGNSQRTNQPQAVLQPLSVSMLQHQNQRKPNNLTKMNIDHMQFKKLAMQHQEEIYSLLDTNTTSTLIPVPDRKVRLNYHFSDVYVPASSHVKLNSLHTNRSNKTVNSTYKLKSSPSNSNNLNQIMDLPSVMFKQATNQLVVKTSNNLRRPKTAKV